MNKSEKLLNEMGFDRKEAVQDAKDLQMHVARHLILVFALPDSQDVQNWYVELEAARDKLSNKSLGRKGQNNFKPAFLNKTLWTEPLSEPADRARRIKQIYDKKGIVVPSFEDRVGEFKTLVDKFISCVRSDIPFKK